MKQMAPLTKDQELQSPGLITERVGELGGPFFRCPPGRQMPGVNQYAKA